MDRDTGYIQRFLADGDKRAFGKLMTLYKDKVYNFCCAYIGNDMDADDCTQEIFIKTYEHLDKFRFDSKFSTWLYRITVNQCNNYVVSKHYKQQKQNTGEMFSEPLSGNTPEQAFINKESETLIYNAIDALKGKQKTVLILRDLEGLGYEEIAAITRLKSGTVKSTLARARFKVAAILKKQNP